MSAVVVVESPAKSKTIEKYLGKGYKVLASYGHIRAFPKKMALLTLKTISHSNIRLLKTKKNVSMTFKKLSNVPTL